MARHPYKRNLVVSLAPRPPLKETLPRFVYSESRKDSNINSHTPWSKWDEQDIRYAVEHEKSLAETADFLCRTYKEVRHKAAAMGLRFEKKKA